MLYITTRNNTDSYTAFRALHQCNASDGGQFVPIRLPMYTSQQLEELSKESFNEIVAQILNMFFSSHLTGWDIEFAVGKKPVKIVDIGRKTVIAELWHNTEGSFSVAANRIYSRLCDYKNDNVNPGGWAILAIRIAFVFGIYAELKRMNIPSFDASVSGRDMESTLAVWYARNMGLPVGKIICGTNENCWAWELIHKGELNPNTCVSTGTPDMDALPSGIERLVFATLGLAENVRYQHAIATSGAYKIDDESRNKLSKGLFASVVGQRRVTDVIASVMRTNNYYLDPYTAISYSALQDYRAKTGENRITLLMAENKPNQ